MSTRTLYFIRDTITGKYYTSASHYELGSFSDAVIHTTESSVEAGIKSRNTRYRKDAAMKRLSKKEFGAVWVNKQIGRAIRRNLKENFAMEVVAITINDERK